MHFDVIDPGSDHGLLEKADAAAREFLLGLRGGRLHEQDIDLLDSMRGDGAVTAVATDGLGALMGMAVLHLRHEVPEIRSVYVREDYRGKGLATRLLDILLEQVGDRGIQRVFTVVAKDGLMDGALRRRGLHPAGPPPDGAPGYVRFDLTVPEPYLRGA